MKIKTEIKKKRISSKTTPSKIKKTKKNFTIFQEREGWGNEREEGGCWRNRKKEEKKEKVKKKKEKKEKK